MTDKTYGEQFQSALACETKEEAEEWMEKEVEYYISLGKTPTEAVKIIKSNLGYMAGYYGHEKAQKIHALFDAIHPIFGTSTYHQDMTTKEAFELVKRRALGKE